MREKYKEAILLVESLIREAELEDATSEQWFLDWIDEINKLSVTY